ncbi:hypothetical protein [Ideonella sp.]|uniref:hypothetical protein n=1 Tax=Ideonella sp. TaxID=1929293 RepID=UPI00351AF2A4
MTFFSSFVIDVLAAGIGARFASAMAMGCLLIEPHLAAPSAACEADYLPRL